MENVTIEEDQNPVVEWSADTSSYPDYLFQEWQIFRKDPGQTQYQKVGTVFNQYKYDFKDNQIGFIKVDQDSYEYRVDMKLNDDMQGATNSIGSVLLERSNGMVPIIDPDTIPVDLIWNQYNGWAVDSYTVFLQEKIGGTWMGEWIHDHVASPQNPVLAPDTTYRMFLELAPGEYRVCIRTTDPGKEAY